MVANQALLTVRGMDNGDSVRRVAESLLGVEGVDDVQVDAQLHVARVRLNELEPADETDLTHAVEEAGFQVERVQMP